MNNTEHCLGCHIQNKSSHANVLISLHSGHYDIYWLEIKTALYLSAVPVLDRQIQTEIAGSGCWFDSSIEEFIADFWGLPWKQTEMENCRLTRLQPRKFHSIATYCLNGCKQSVTMMSPLFATEWCDNAEKKSVGCVQICHLNRQVKIHLYFMLDMK